MDGIHDLGGKLGYGAIDVGEPETPFHHDYEGRMWAISRTAKATGVTIDWWRHMRELIDPDDYIKRPYFDSWAQTHMASMIDAGMFTFDELDSGVSTTLAPQIETLDAGAVFKQNASMAFKFDRDVETPPKYAVGQTVLTNAQGTRGHTRLPEYARGSVGTIIAHHGAHIFADDGAKGLSHPQHLYTVSFKATTLWGDGANPNDSVSLELWEDYFVDAE